jgi:hypothetical protein
MKHNVDICFPETLMNASSAASTSSAVVACSKIAVAHSLDHQGQAARLHPSEFWQHANHIHRYK